MKIRTYYVWVLCALASFYLCASNVYEGNINVAVPWGLCFLLQLRIAISDYIEHEESK